MKLNINKNLLPMKGHYFLFNAGISPVQPFMPVIAKDLNFSSDAFGIINAILPFTGMLSKPIFGAIADRFRLHKFIFLTFQILTILGFFNIQFISKLEKNRDSQVKLVCGAETNFDVCFKEPNKYTGCLIQDVLKEAESNKTIKCSLRCDLSPELRTELCGPWKANPNICIDDLTTKTNVGKYMHITKDEAKVSTSHLSEAISSTQPLEDVKLEFVASVPIQHTLKVADCLYFRVANAKLNDESVHIPYCEHEIDTQCKIHCEDSKLAELLMTQENSKPDADFVHYHQFWIFLFLAIISWVGMAVVGSVADAVCFELLGEKANQYGNQRLWGSIGWGTFALIAGLVVDQFSKDGKTNYTPVFYIMLVVIICDVVCSYNLKYEQTKVSSHIFKNVWRLLKDPWIDIFLVWCIIIGMCVGVQWTFLFWHLENLITCDDRSSKKTLLGLVSGIQSFLGELPSFFLYGWIVKKIGHIHMMTLIPLVIGVRFILYSILPNPWWTLPIELFQCSLGLSFAVMASYASLVAPAGAEATVQGLVGAIFEGIGVSLGSYLGGVIFHKYGGPELFQIFGIIAFALCIGHGIIHFLLGKNSKLQSQAKELAVDEGIASDSSLETTDAISTEWRNTQPPTKQFQC